MTKQYLDLIRHVLINGVRTTNRTGVPTRSIFGHQMRFDLRDGTLPLLTTKPMPFKTIARELFWFMQGDTNQRTLERQGIKIWKANATRAFLDSRNLQHYTEYESLGPIYGFQWRHFGASYTDCYTDYTGRGVDQLANVIEAIRHDPTSRRIILTAWNPSALDAMVLPPCHTLVQFSVNVETNELSAHLYQRSGDLMLGVPFNIASYALFVHILARLCDRRPGHLVHSLGDVHIYEPHIVGATEQIQRIPKPPPTIEIRLVESNDVNGRNDSKCKVGWRDVINQLDCNQFKLVNYQCDQEPLNFTMIA